MSEKFSHAFFITLHFEIHVNLEVFGVTVSVGSFQKHSQIIYGAVVALANINNEARILTLNKCNLTIFILRFKHKTWFCNE